MDTTSIINKLQALIDELSKILEGSYPNNINLAWDRLNRWKDRAIKTVSSLVSPLEGDRINGARLGSFSMMDPWKNVRKQINSYEAHLQALIEEIKNNPEFILSNTEQVDSQVVAFPSDLARLEKLCRRFHKVAKQLRSRHDNRATIEIEDEYDVQDLFHALLRIEFDDIRPEEWTPSYAGGSSRTDFLLKQEKVVIEIKKTRKGLGDKEVGEQLIIDIERYKIHPDCKSLICFVYDPEGRIANPQGIISDLEGRSKGKFDLKVIIEPQS